MKSIYSFQTFRELLDAFIDFFDTFGIQLDECVFRGQDSKYSLVPAVLRESIPKFEHELAEREYHDVQEFTKILYTQGYSLPCSSFMRKQLLLSNSSPYLISDVDIETNKYLWPNDDVLCLLSMMQHYNIPTRLLDWTYSFMVAVFFACEGGLRRVKLEYDQFINAKGELEKQKYRQQLTRTMNDDMASVWILRSYSGFNFINEELGVSNYRVFLPPLSTNPNAFAQQGLFIYRVSDIQKPDMFGHYFEVTPINTQPLDHLTTLNGTSNPLIKTEFPIGECGKAYDILKGFSCTTSRLFPDLGGIRRQMMDQEAYGKFQEAYKMLTN